MLDGKTVEERTIETARRLDDLAQILTGGEVEHARKVAKLQIEIEQGPFRRAVELGADVDSEQAQATY